MADGLFDFFSGGDFAAPPATAPAPQLFDLGDPSTGAPNPPISPSGGMLQPWGGGPGAWSEGGPGAGGFDWTKYLPAAIAGGTGLIGYLRGQGSASDKAIKELHGATGPMGAAGNQALQAYTTGTLTGPQQAVIDQYKRQRIAQLEQEAIASGAPVSSMRADFMAQADREALAMSQQMLQQDFQNAVGATGMSVNNLTNIARMQALQDAEQRAQWAAFMKELGKLGGDIFGGQGPGVMSETP